VIEPPRKPPFDALRASFFLIAAILAVHCIIALLVTGACLYWSGEIVAGKFSCDKASSTLSELLTGALAAALAFAGGFNRKDNP